MVAAEWLALVGHVHRIKPEGGDNAIEHSSPVDFRVRRVMVVEVPHRAAHGGREPERHFFASLLVADQKAPQRSIDRSCTIQVLLPECRRLRWLADRKSVC